VKGYVLVHESGKVFYLSEGGEKSNDIAVLVFMSRDAALRALQSSSFREQFNIAPGLKGKWAIKGITLGGLKLKDGKAGLGDG
jgi:hypothetical protein